MDTPHDYLHSGHKTRASCTGSRQGTTFWQRAGEKHWHKPEHKLVQYALDRIRAEGSLQAKDFEQGQMRNPDGW